MSDASIGINIGNTTDMKAASEPLAAALVSIMSSPAEQETIREALRVFGRSVQIENITIQGANVIGPRTINIDSEEPA